MNKRTQKSEQTRLNALQDLYINDGEYTSLRLLSIKYGIHSDFFSTMVRESLIIKDTAKGAYRWNEHSPYDGEPDVEMVRRLMKRQDEIFVRAWRRRTAASIPPSTNGKVGLNLTIQFTLLGNRYGITGRRLETFVKEALEIHQRGNGA